MWALREGTHPVLTDEGGAILDEHTGRWTHLTPTATAAVLLLCSSQTMEQAAAAYATRYGLPPHQAHRDVRAVAGALTAAGLTVASLPRPRAWRWRR